MADATLVTPTRAVVAVGDAATDKDAITRAILNNLPQIVPGVPNSAWVPILLGQLRQIAAVASGLGMGYSEWVSGEKLTFYASAIVGAVALVLSAWQKVRQIVARYRAAAASAAATAAATAGTGFGTGVGVPVAVAVTDPKAPSPLGEPTRGDLL